MKVHLASVLDEYTGGLRTVEGTGRRIAAVLDDLETRYPGIRFRVIDEQGAIRPHMRIFVAGHPVTGVNAPVGADDEVHILAALSGG